MEAEIWLKNGREIEFTENMAGKCDLDTPVPSGPPHGI